MLSREEHICNIFVNESHICQSPMSTYPWDLQINAHQSISLTPICLTPISIHQPSSHLNLTHTLTHTLTHITHLANTSNTYLTIIHQHDITSTHIRHTTQQHNYTITPPTSLHTLTPKTYLSHHLIIQRDLFDSQITYLIVRLVYLIVILAYLIVYLIVNDHI